MTNQWIPISFKHEQVLVSHMSFANDIVIFGQASMENIGNMLVVLDDFCYALGQQINYAKSQVICSNDLDSEIAHVLFEIKGFSRATQDITYLCFPFIKNAKCTSNLNTMVTKIDNKITSWKLKPLSQAGRIIMIKSILLSLPICLMACYKFPKNFCSKMHSSICRFWKNQGDLKYSIQWDSWSTLCKKKKD